MTEFPGEFRPATEYYPDDHTGEFGITNDHGILVAVGRDPNGEWLTLAGDWPENHS